MKKNYINIVTSIFVASLLFSCSDDFITNSPINGENEDTFYKDDVQMFAGLMAAYDVLQWTEGSNHFIPFSEIRSDNARSGGGGQGDYMEYQQMEAFTNADDNALSMNLWKNAYAGIYRSNLIINNEYESDEATIYKAEAKFLRAWYHFDLLRTFGPCYIGLETAYPMDYKFVRNTREEVNLQIENDLEEAIPILLESHSDDMIGRITKGAAQALLAKVYIYWADWANDNQTIFDKAIPLLEEVKGKYTLSNRYDLLFAPHNENNSESIFEVQHSVKQGTGSWTDVGIVAEGNYWCQFSGPRGLSKHPEVDGGWGLLVPRQAFYDYFLEEDSIRRDASFWIFEDLDGIVAGTDTSTWNVAEYGGSAGDFEGYAQRKYTTWNNTTYPDMVGNISLNRPGNERIIRLGEVYLLLAECYLRGTAINEGMAKDLMNELRVAHVGGGDASKCMTVDEMITAEADFNNVLDVLWYERRCELAGEGDRWFDLVRTGRAKGVINALYPGAWNDQHNYIPISQVETGASGGSLTAYPEEPAPTPPVY